ncbi:MAG: universal stress protein [Anaerolineales bacterium]
MNEERERALSVQRILVALDASAHSRAALRAALELASRFGAQLEGLFVEDVTLLRLAALPFAQEVGHYSAIRRGIDQQQVERQLHVRSVQIRRTFYLRAREAGVDCTFRVVRGIVVTEVLTSAEEADVVVLGRAGWSLSHARRMGGTARTLIEEVPTMTLILQDGARLGTPVLVVYDGSKVADRALDVAAEVLEDDENVLTILLLPEDAEQVRDLRAQVEKQLRGTEVQRLYRLLTVSTVSRLVQRVRLEERGMLVLPAQPVLLQDEVLLQLVEEIDVPVLLVK